MKKAAAFLCLAILCPALCLAQRGGGRRGGARGGAHILSEDQTIDLFTLLVELQDDQPQKLRSILDAGLATAIPMRQQASPESDPLFEAARSGKSDEEIAKIAEAQAGAACGRYGRTSAPRAPASGPQ